MLTGQGVENIFGDMVDFSKEPYVPMGWRKVLPHEYIPVPLSSYKKMDGKWRYSSRELELFSADITIYSTLGHMYRQCFDRLVLMGAPLLDFILANQQSIYIPEHWKDYNIYFCGTPYYNEEGKLAVRCLFNNGGRWYWGFKLLSQPLGKGDVFLVRNWNLKE